MSLLALFFFGIAWLSHTPIVLDPVTAVMAIAVSLTGCGATANAAGSGVTGGRLERTRVNSATCTESAAAVFSTAVTSNR